MQKVEKQQSTKLVNTLSSLMVSLTSLLIIYPGGSGTDNFSCRTPGWFQLWLVIPPLLILRTCTIDTQFSPSLNPTSDSYHHHLRLDQPPHPTRRHGVTNKIAYEPLRIPSPSQCTISPISLPQLDNPYARRQGNISIP